MGRSIHSMTTGTMTRQSATLSSAAYNPESPQWILRSAIWKRFLEHLKHNDPDAILYVYGDHGPGLSQGVSFEDAPTFVVQDKLGVLGGVYPPDACATYFDETLSKGYMTALDGVHCHSALCVRRPKCAQDATSTRYSLRH